eukprot:scaffold8560_cov66-Phaeocystis_antarctica.AAC.1
MGSRVLAAEEQREPSRAAQESTEHRADPCAPRAHRADPCAPRAHRADPCAPRAHRADPCAPRAATLLRGRGHTAARAAARICRRRPSAPSRASTSPLTPAGRAAAGDASSCSRPVCSEGEGEGVGVPLYRPSGMSAGSHAWPSDVVSATSAYRAGEPAWSEMALATPGGKLW